MTITSTYIPKAHIRHDDGKERELFGWFHIDRA